MLGCNIYMCVYDPAQKTHMAWLDLWVGTNYTLLRVHVFCFEMDINNMM